MRKQKHSIAPSLLSADSTSPCARSKEQTSSPDCAIPPTPCVHPPVRSRHLGHIRHRRGHGRGVLPQRRDRPGRGPDAQGAHHLRGERRAAGWVHPRQSHLRVRLLQDFDPARGWGALRAQCLVEIPNSARARRRTAGPSSTAASPPRTVPSALRSRATPRSCSASTPAAAAPRRTWRSPWSCRQTRPPLGIT